MEDIIIPQAKDDYLIKIDKSPTKAALWLKYWEAVVQTSYEMSHVVMAHKISKDTDEKAFFKKGMHVEADIDFCEWYTNRNY